MHRDFAPQGTDPTRRPPRQRPPLTRLATLPLNCVGKVAYATRLPRRDATRLSRREPTVQLRTDPELRIGPQFHLLDWLLLATYVVFREVLFQLSGTGCG